MMPIIIPQTYNYIAAFLTLHCNLHCSYCINKHGNFYTRKLMTGEEWVSILNKIESRPDLPITLQGGEPTLHPDFYYIVDNVKPELKLDLLTNLQFNIYYFMEKIKPERFKRDASYASIRVSYHPEQTRDMLKLAADVFTLQNNGYSIGIWAVDHPASKEKIGAMKEVCEYYDLNFLVKPFLGEYQGKFYGEYKYPDACGEKKTKTVQCKTTEFLIAPDGYNYRCHADLYAGRYPLGHASYYKIEDIYRPCSVYGSCNPCDVKLKYDRFGNAGWTSTDIKEIENEK